MIEVLVTSTGLFLGNAELAWIRSQSLDSAVEVILGSLLGAEPQPPDHRLAFCRSHCTQWESEPFSCAESEIQLELEIGVEHQIVAWTEADDRRDPQRTMIVIAPQWSFHPADIDLDGTVDCGDIDAFLASAHDWNLDGSVTESDLADLIRAAAELMADLDGDGEVTDIDLVVLLQLWGSCPDSETGIPCPGDLDCDGNVGINDMLLVIGLNE